MNNFQQLEAKKELDYPNVVEDVKHRVDKSLDMYKFVGNILDLYVPKIFGFIGALLGGEQKENKKSRYPNRP